MTSNEQMPGKLAETTFELQAPGDLVGQVAALLPGLVEQGVRRLEVFSYSRPGEPAYWLAFIITDSGRHSVGTPELRHLSLDEQVPELCRQMAAWQLAPGPVAPLEGF